MFDSTSGVGDTSLPRYFGRSEASLSPDVKRSFPPEARAKRSREIFSSNEEAVESYPERMKGNERLCF